MIPMLPTPPSRDDPVNFSFRADAFLAALPAWTDAANALEQSLQLVATTGTSATGMTVGTGSKSFTASTGKAWAVGAYVYVVCSVNITQLMYGQVTAYNSSTGAMTVNVTSAQGTGTYSVWTVGLSVPMEGSPVFSGPVGVGVAPLTWTSYTVLSIGAAGTSMYGLPTEAGIVTNAYFDGSWRYYNAGSAPTRYASGGAAHYFQSAVAGTNGAVLTWVTNFVVDATDGPQRPNDASTANGLVRKSQMDSALSAAVPTAASSATTRTGTNTTQFVTSKGLADTMLCGVGQTLQDMTASRALSTTYTNSTGRPIAVSVTTTAGGGPSYFGITVDGRLEQQAYSPAGFQASVKALVGPGETYSVSGSVTIAAWLERR